MKRLTKILSVVTAAGILASMSAVMAYAEKEEQKIRIVIENNTLSAEDGADWTGTLLDEWVSADTDSTAASLLLDVLGKHGFSQTGTEQGYITEINGLSAEDGGSMGGWMLTLDDWITDEGISAYTVSSGKLENGDEIKLVYSCSWGGDIGYDWSGNDTSLSGVEISAGKLTTEFSGDKFDYILELPSDTDSITIRPRMTNKAYRAKVYKNNYTPAEAGTDIKFSEELEVSDGDVIIIGTANETWMQANYNNAQESIYRISINKESTVDTDVQEAESLINAIGEVTESSSEALFKARAFYEELSDEQKVLVTNYDVLVAAEKKMSEIKETSRKYLLEDFKSNFIDNMAKELCVGREWEVISLYGFREHDIMKKADYIDSVIDLIKQTGSEKLSSTRSTVNSGVIIALSSIGIDASNFDGYNLLKPLADFEYVEQQGINGDIYALIAINTKDYKIPECEEGCEQTTEDKLIKSILDAQEDDGGWTIDTWTGVEDGSDADMTAMALQALAPYYNSDKNVRTAVDRALEFLSENQNDDGMFVSYGSADCESCAQVVIALCSLDIDIFSDTRFIKNGNDVFSALMKYCTGDDLMFSHYAGGEANSMSTVQAYTALAALYDYKEADRSIFCMDDIIVEPFHEESSDVSDISESSKKEVSESSKDVSEKSISPNTDNVKTGDNNSLAAVIFILLISSAAVVFSVKRSRNN